MERLFKNLRALGQLGDVLEPPPAPSPAGVEHVMVEIAPGVFRSVNRQRRPPAAAGLLRELQQAQALREQLAGAFQGVRAAMKPQKPVRNPYPKGAQEIPDANRSRQR